MCWGGSECVGEGMRVSVSKAGFTQDTFQWSVAAIIKYYYKNM